MKHAAQRGLTLIELAIALALMALLAVLAVPNMGAQLDQRRLLAAAETLAADMAEARFEAARQGRPMHLTVQGGASWCWSVASSAGCPCGQRQTCELRSASADDHAAVQTLQGQSLLLTPTGAAQTAGAVTLQSRRGSRLQVQLQALGRPRICSELGPASRYPSC